MRSESTSTLTLNANVQCKWYVICGAVFSNPHCVLIHVYVNDLCERYAFMRMRAPAIYALVACMRGPVCWPNASYTSLYRDLLPFRRSTIMCMWSCACGIKYTLSRDLLTSARSSLAPRTCARTRTCTHTYTCTRARARADARRDAALRWIVAPSDARLLVDRQGCCEDTPVALAA